MGFSSPRESQVVFFKENFIKCWPHIVSILSKASDLTSKVRLKKEEEKEKEDREDEES